jgi:phosphotriesterase-related protein
MRNINTINGSVNTDSMGITLMHEHVFNLYPYYKEKENTEYVKKQIEKLRIFNVGTIVDLTPYAKIGSYKNFINQCDINIICAIGFYIDKHIPASYKNASVSELVEKLSKKIEVGIGENKYKPGVIKIAASNPKLSDRQKRFYEAATILHKNYRIPLATHSPSGGLEHLKVLIQMGAIPEHLYLSHLENEIDDINFDLKIHDIENVLENNANIVITNFGTNDVCSRYKNSIKLLQYLKDNSFLSQTLISADSNWRWKGNAIKLRDSHINGVKKTYSYVFDFIVPALKNLFLLTMTSIKCLYPIQKGFLIFKMRCLICWS